MSTPEIISLKIESLANSGDGVGRWDEKVVFVPYTAPGDIVEVEIIETKRSYCRGTLKKINKPSPIRQKPPCPYFGECGGCTWQHLEYQSQLQIKKENLEQTLQRVAGLEDLPIENTVPSPKTLHYRNRIRVEYENGSFYYKKRRESQRVAVDQCLIADEEINSEMLALAKVLPKKKQSLELALTDEGVESYTIRANRTSELGFRQVNSDQKLWMQNKNLQILSSGAYSQVFDLYCGQGDWTCEMAKAAPSSQILGIDSSRDNISSAEHNATLAKLTNVTFLTGRVEDTIPQWSNTDSFCIVDPPRSGLDLRVTEALEAHPMKTLIYISCHPATLARDLKILEQSTYKVEQIIPVDMFPQTAHLETWCLLHSKK